MTSTDTALQAKTTIATVIYGIVALLAGGIGAALITKEPFQLLGIGLILFAVVGFGWSCFARNWFFKSNQKELAQ